MASSGSIYNLAVTTLSKKTESDVPAKLILPRGVRLLSVTEHILQRAFGCKNHNWNFPRTIKGKAYPEPFDSHQACTECGQERYFNFKTMVSGPQFKGENDGEK